MITRVEYPLIFKSSNDYGYKLLKFLATTTTTTLPDGRDRTGHLQQSGLHPTFGGWKRGLPFRQHLHSIRKQIYKLIATILSILSNSYVTLVQQLTKDDTDPETLLPVIVWIHGGSFRSGQAVEYLPGRFMEERVILVVIQYRLGPLGQLPKKLKPHF